MSNQLKKTTVWFSVRNGGDGSAYPVWFLTRPDADKDQENMCEGWGESCIGSVQTYEGADIHTEAKNNSGVMKVSLDIQDMSRSEVSEYMNQNKLPFIFQYDLKGKYIPSKVQGPVYRIDDTSKEEITLEVW